MATKKVPSTSTAGKETIKSRYSSVNLNALHKPVAPSTAASAAPKQGPKGLVALGTLPSQKDRRGTKLADLPKQASEPTISLAPPAAGWGKKADEAPSGSQPSDARRGNSSVEASNQTNSSALTAKIGWGKKDLCDDVPSDKLGDEDASETAWSKRDNLGDSRERAHGRESDRGGCSAREFDRNNRDNRFELDRRDERERDRRDFGRNFRNQDRRDRDPVDREFRNQDRRERDRDRFDRDQREQDRRNRDRDRFDRDARDQDRRDRDRDRYDRDHYNRDHREGDFYRRERDQERDHTDRDAFRRERDIDRDEQRNHDEKKNIERKCSPPNDENSHRNRDGDDRDTDRRVRSNDRSDHDRESKERLPARSDRFPDRSHKEQEQTQKFPARSDRFPDRSHKEQEQAQRLPARSDRFPDRSHKEQEQAHNERNHESSPSEKDHERKEADNDRANGVRTQRADRVPKSWADDDESGESFEQPGRRFVSGDKKVEPVEPAQDRDKDRPLGTETDFQKNLSRLEDGNSRLNEAEDIRALKLSAGATRRNPNFVALPAPGKQSSTKSATAPGQLPILAKQPSIPAAAKAEPKPKEAPSQSRPHKDGESVPKPRSSAGVRQSSKGGSSNTAEAAFHGSAKSPPENAGPAPQPKKSAWAKPDDSKPANDEWMWPNPEEAKAVEQGIRRAPPTGALIPSVQNKNAQEAEERSDELADRREKGKGKGKGKDREKDRRDRKGKEKGKEKGNDNGREKGKDKGKHGYEKGKGKHKGKGDDEKNRDEETAEQLSEDVEKNDKEKEDNDENTTNDDNEVSALTPNKWSPKPTRGDWDTDWRRRDEPAANWWESNEAWDQGGNTSRSRGKTQWQNNYAAGSEDCKESTWEKSGQKWGGKKGKKGKGSKHEGKGGNSEDEEKDGAAGKGHETKGKGRSKKTKWVVKEATDQEKEENDYSQINKSWNQNWHESNWHWDDSKHRWMKSASQKQQEEERPPMRQKQQGSEEKNDDSKDISMGKDTKDNDAEGSKLVEGKGVKSAAGKGDEGKFAKGTKRAEGKGFESKGGSGKGADRKVTEDKASGKKGSEGKGNEGKRTDGKGKRQDFKGKGADGKGFEGKGAEGRSMESDEANRAKAAAEKLIGRYMADHPPAENAKVAAIRPPKSLALAAASKPPTSQVSQQKAVSSSLPVQNSQPRADSSTTGATKQETIHPPIQKVLPGGVPAFQAVGDLKIAFGGGVVCVQAASPSGSDAEDDNFQVVKSKKQRRQEREEKRRQAEEDASREAERQVLEASKEAPEASGDDPLPPEKEEETILVEKPGKFGEGSKAQGFSAFSRDSTVLDLMPEDTRSAGLAPQLSMGVGFPTAVGSPFGAMGGTLNSQPTKEIAAIWERPASADSAVSSDSLLRNALTLRRPLRPFGNPPSREAPVPSRPLLLRRLGLAIPIARREIAPMQAAVGSSAPAVAAPRPQNGNSTTSSSIVGSATSAAVVRPPPNGTRITSSSGSRSAAISRSRLPGANGELGPKSGVPASGAAPRVSQSVAAPSSQSDLAGSATIGRARPSGPTSSNPPSPGTDGSGQKKENTSGTPPSSFGAWRRENRTGAGVWRRDQESASAADEGGEAQSRHTQGSSWRDSTGGSDYGKSGGKGKRKKGKGKGRGSGIADDEWASRKGGAHRGRGAGRAAGFHEDEAEETQRVERRLFYSDRPKKGGKGKGRGRPAQVWTEASTSRGSR